MKHNLVYLLYVLMFDIKFFQTKNILDLQDTFFILKNKIIIIIYLWIMKFFTSG